MERKINKKIILMSLLLATFFFCSCFLISYTLSYNKINQIAAMQDEIKHELLNLENNALTAPLCENTSLYTLNERLDYIGSITDILEKNLGKTNSQVLEQKKIYSSIEYEHFLIIKETNTKCKKNITTVLFFYSNDEKQKESEDVGYILDVLKAKFKDSVMIYSFDYNLDSDTVNLLKGIYKVNNRPAVVLNENPVLYSIKDIKDIENLLK
jgi:glycerophosphoryl diester phosphodiesterase